MKIIALLLALMFCFMAAFAEEGETADEIDAAQNEENEIAGIGYIDPYEEFYVVVPVEWAVIGVGSTPQNLEDAERILEGTGIDPYEIYDSLYPDNPDKRNCTLICLASDAKTGMTLTYGTSEYVTNSAMIDQMDAIKSEIKAQVPNLSFVDAECGSYSFKSLENILHLRMRYGESFIDQYYLINGTTMFLFTFYNASEENINAVFYFFKTGVKEFDKEVAVVDGN